MSVINEVLSNNIVRMILTIIMAYISIKINSYIFSKFNKDNLIHFKFTKSIVSAIIVVSSAYVVGKQIPSLSGFINTVIASTSLLVVVAGFAAQEALSNVLNGLMISMFKPFNIGDRVKLVTANITGYIEDITLRHTVIKTFTNSRVIVPNSVINKEIVENSYYYEIKTSMLIDVIIDYKADLVEAKKIIKEAVESNKLVLSEYNVDVLVRDLGLHGVCLRVQVWTQNIDDSFKACSAIREDIKLKFDSANIKFASTNVKINEGEM